VSGNSHGSTNDLGSMLIRRFGLVLVFAIGGLTACGGDGDAPTRAYTVALRMEDHEDEYHYRVAGEVPTFTVGDEVTFEAENSGTLAHDLQVVGPDGLTRGTAEAVFPGASLTLTVRLEEPGIYQLNCLVDNHLTEHGMQALIQVVEA
jgi:uncharacterized cupredoxin-like copper-binding protein